MACVLSRRDEDCENEPIQAARRHNEYHNLGYSPWFRKKQSHEETRNQPFLSDGVHGEIRPMDPGWRSHLLPDASGRHTQTSTDRLGKTHSIGDQCEWIERKSRDRIIATYLGCCRRNQQPLVHPKQNDSCLQSMGLDRGHTFLGRPLL